MMDCRLLVKPSWSIISNGIISRDETLLAKIPHLHAVSCVGKRSSGVGIQNLGVDTSRPSQGWRLFYRRAERERVVARVEEGGGRDTIVVCWDVRGVDHFSKMETLLRVPGRPGPGWIRPCCCCSVCSVEEIDLSANSSSAASSWSPKGGRDRPGCLCW